MSRHLPDYTRDTPSLEGLLLAVAKLSDWQEAKFTQLQKKFPKPDGGVISKTEALAALVRLKDKIKLDDQTVSRLKRWLQMKPTRTISGVAPVTVLTKPFPCPGKCIFCPSDVRMPKSYLSDEPGAQRAEKNYFDPYLQTYNRLQALSDMGHDTDKIELIILGGTWSFYPEQYQRWFIHECFRAMNEFGLVDDSPARREIYAQTVVRLQRKNILAMTDDPVKNAASFGSKKILAADLTYNQVISELYVKPEKLLGLDTWQTASWTDVAKVQKINETANSRCVGLVLETRPDHISETEVIKLRKLGATKTQIGVQSLQDEVLYKNHRGHNVAATRTAFKLLRQAGFKIHAHWMPNLYGSSVIADIADYKKLFTDPDFKPDELKIYPCSLIESAELVTYYRQGLWRPYTEQELLEVLTQAFQLTPAYCRLTRVIRDIPSPDIMVGNKKTNFRQIVQDHLATHQIVIQDIRSREIRAEKFEPATIEFSQVEYATGVSQEVFLQFTAEIAARDPKRGEKLSSARSSLPERRLLAFLRLSLPIEKNFIPELIDAAIIREVHVYGKVSKIGQLKNDQAQHVGLGTQLIAKARTLALAAGFKKLAVISAIGTREYYRSRGFSDGELYQFLNCEDF